MRQQFPGHFKNSDVETKEIWSDCIFVFDTNVLLGLYRYSPNTRDEFFKIFRLLGERLWIPHQTAEEYFRNRLTVIKAQADSYQKISTDLTDIEKSLSHPNKHPFISAELLKDICSNFELARKELEVSENDYNNRILDDDILEEIDDIFGDFVGSAFDESRLKEIVEEGKERYDSETPPGWADKKKNAPDDRLQYGDLILWFQTMEMASERNQNVILVSDDVKKDWWWEFSGKTIGPQPELIAEFLDKTGKRLLMYNSERFLKFASEHFDTEVSKEAFQEVRELTKASPLNNLELFVRDSDLKDLNSYYSQIEGDRLVVSHLSKEHAESLNELNLELRDIILSISRNADPEERARLLREKARIEGMITEEEETIELLRQEDIILDKQVREFLSAEREYNSRQDNRH